MATPQSPDQMAAMVDNIAAKQMGVAPQQAEQTQQANEPPKESSQEKASQ